MDAKSLEYILMGCGGCIQEQLITQRVMWARVIEHDLNSMVGGAAF